jgi:hypothetical protein
MKEDFKCDRCGKPITGAYGSMGGNIVPYIPAKFYHLACIPTLKELAEKILTSDAAEMP